MFMRHVCWKVLRQAGECCWEDMGLPVEESGDQDAHWHCLVLEELMAGGCEISMA
jgi:hypothetical protein